jgi:hypothetical protein
MSPPLEFGHRTGAIDLLDYDQAVVEGLGAVLNIEKGQYALPLVDPMTGEGIFVTPETADEPIQITEALVRFKQAEPTRDEWDLPCVLVMRDDATPAQARMWSPAAPEYRLPAPGATPVVVGGYLGWTAYETKPREIPYDFSYTIECWSRYRVVAQVLLQMAMVRYPLYGSLKVVDGLGVEREYHAFQEGTGDLTEISTMVDRVCGFSLTVRVEGELTLSSVPQADDVFLGGTTPNDPNNPGNPYDPNNPANPGDPANPDPGPGGIYADGQPIKRVTVIGSDE